jgi:MoxR-like ATPase
MENNNTEKLQEQINLAADKIAEVKNEVHKKIVGQENLIDSLIIGLLAKGHILIE